MGRKSAATYQVATSRKADGKHEKKKKKEEGARRGAGQGCAAPHHKRRSNTAHPDKTALKGR